MHALAENPKALSNIFSLFFSFDGDAVFLVVFIFFRYNDIKEKHICCHHYFPSHLQESQKTEANQIQRRHERKKEKRKKSARLQIQHQQTIQESLEQAGTTAQMEETHIQPQPRELRPQSEPLPTPPPVHMEMPQRTVIKTEPKTPKV